MPSWIPYKDKKLIEDFSDFSTKLANSTHVENNFTHCEFHNPLKFEYIIKIFNEKRTPTKKRRATEMEMVVSEGTRNES